MVFYWSDIGMFCADVDPYFCPAWHYPVGARTIFALQHEECSKVFSSSAEGVLSYNRPVIIHASNQGAWIGVGGVGNDLVVLI